MRALSFLASLTLIGSSPCVLGQGEVHVDDRLPPASVELKAGEPPATSAPWQLPKPGDPLYDAEKEAEIRNDPKSHWAHAFERGVFKGYVTITSGPSRDRPAKKMGSAFTPNPKLPPDAVELSASERPDKSYYFQIRPKLRPANVPDDFVAVRVFHRGKFIGWSWLPKDGVAALHKPKLKVRVTRFGYPGDPQATNTTRLGLGDHNNILNKDSVAVTPDLDGVFPFGSKVYLEGKFLGFRDTTLTSKLHYTIAVYDPKGEWTGDFDSYVERPAKKK
jgi:hypothetical protein